MERRPILRSEKSVLKPNMIGFHNESTTMESGFSLIETLIALGVLSVAGTAVLKQTVTSLKANKSNELRMDIQDIKRTVLNTISCDHTLGATRPSTCSGLQVLKDRSGKEIAPNGKLDTWTIEAICEKAGTPAKNGLSIYVTKKREDGSYLMDPLRGVAFDKKHPSSALFEPATRLCSANFSSAPAPTGCPNGISSINFDNQTFVCAKLNITPCPFMQYVTGVTNGVRTCGSPP